MMNTDLERVLKLNTSPAFVIVAFSVGAACMLAMTCWSDWVTWQSHSTIGLSMFLAFASASSVLASEGKERLAVNRVLKRVQAALGA